MTDELDLAPDLASQQWWDDNWVQVSSRKASTTRLLVLRFLQVAAGGSLATPTLAYVQLPVEDPKLTQAAGGTLRRAYLSTMRPTTGDCTFSSARMRPSIGPGWKSKQYWASDLRLLTSAKNHVHHVRQTVPIQLQPLSTAKLLGH